MFEPAEVAEARGARGEGRGNSWVLTVRDDNLGAAEQVSELLCRLNVHCSRRHGKC